MEPRGGQPKWQEGPTVRLRVGGGGRGPRPPRRRWKNVVKGAAWALSVPVVAALFSLLLEYGVVQRLLGDEQDDDTPSLDGPSRTWETKGRSADVAGVHAAGDTWRQDDGSVYVTGTLTDTSGDGYSVKITIEAVDADGRVEPATKVNSGGHGSSVSLGVGGPDADPKSSGRFFRGDIREIRVDECLLDRDEHDRKYETACGSAPAVIWTAS